MVHIHSDLYILYHAEPWLPGIWEIIIAEHSYCNMECSINCVLVRAHMYVCLCSGTINSQEILDWQAHNSMHSTPVYGRYRYQYLILCRHSFYHLEPYDDLKEGLWVWMLQLCDIYIISADSSFILYRLHPQASSSAAYLVSSLRLYRNTKIWYVEHTGSQTVNRA